MDEEILKQGIREVVMHEVGHTLGLRHNFKASSAITWDQTQDKAYTQVSRASHKRTRDREAQLAHPKIGMVDLV